MYVCMYVCMYLASGLMIPVLRSNPSFSSVWRCGSISMFLQTLLIVKVKRSRTLSCLCVTKPPFLHEVSGHYGGRMAFSYLRSFAVFSWISTSTGMKNWLELFSRSSIYASSNFVRDNISPICQIQQLARQIRHLASTPRGRKHHVSRIRYYANLDSTFHQAHLLTSGDVPLNPGPITNSPRCSVCTKIIARNHRALTCDQCEL